MRYRCQECNRELDGTAMVVKARANNCDDADFCGPFAPILDSYGKPIVETRPDNAPEVRTAVEA